MSFAPGAFTIFSKSATAVGAWCCAELGARAIAQTKMTISQRAPVDGVICDVVCTGRFYDFFEKRDGRWGLVLRRLVYEKDRLDPVDPSAKLALDRVLWERFCLASCSPPLGGLAQRGRGTARGAVVGAQTVHAPSTMLTHGSPPPFHGEEFF